MNQGLRFKIATMKRDSEISLNGYTVKKQGNLWITKKGDFYHRSFTEQQLDKLVEKLSVVEAPAVTGKVKSPKKAAKLAKKIASKDAKVKVVAEKKVKAVAEKKVKAEKVAVEKTAVVKPEKKQKKNSIILEVFNLIVQSIAYFTWYLYFFTNLITEYTEAYIGNNSIFVAIGIGMFALIIHTLYSLQLGKRHRIMNIINGFIMILMVIAGLTYLGGGIQLDALNFQVVLEQVLLVLSSVVNIVLIAFMSLKWVLLFIAPKR